MSAHLQPVHDLRQETLHTTGPAFLKRTRLRAQRRTLWARALWAADTAARGVAITDEEVDRTLCDPAEMAEQQARFYTGNSEARELTAQIAQADERASSDERWCTLCSVFELTDEESDLLALAASVSADPAFGRVCGYLHDDASACYATLLLASSLFDWQKPMLANGALARWGLAHVPDQSTSPYAPNTPWFADPYIVQWLSGEQALDPSIAAAVEVIFAREAMALEVLDPECLRGMHSFLSSVPSPVEIELTGPDGTGKRTLAAQLCAQLGSDLMTVDARVLAADAAAEQHVMNRAVHAMRSAGLERRTLYWNHAEALDARTRQRIEGSADLAFFASQTPARVTASTKVARVAFTMRALDQAQQARLWQGFTDQPFPEAMRSWSLRPAELRSAAQSAGAGPSAVLAACRHMLHADPGELFTPLPCPYGWDDIVLAPSLRKQLEELAAHARLSPAVLEDWGFERLCRMGRGLTVLFAGPSGTGKTMAAQVVAHELGRELYRVDLAGVVNKYIGETEKRLKQVFDACERSAVVLFFDEADALFGQRTQVKEAHDRYANIQIDYLLQRMEQFNGVAILATNRKNDLDTAFCRRLRFIVDFLPPGVPERLALWRIALPFSSPSGEPLLDGIAFDWLAENLTLTGADIKSIALASAFLARSDGSRIRMEHVMHAARREMNKHGAAWRGGEWRGNG